MDNPEKAITANDKSRKTKPRPSRLQKHSSKLIVTGLMATTMLLSACGEKDCYTLYKPVNQPASSTFTGSNNQQSGTYCYGNENRYYGSSYVYIGSSYFGSSSSGTSS
jgi:hypothetical protein